MKTTQKPVSVILPVEGMTCASCVNRIEKTLRKIEGVGSVSANLATEKVSLLYDSSLVSLKELAKSLDDSGYHLVLPPDRAEKTTAVPANESQFNILRREFILSAILMLCIMARSIGGMFPDLVPAEFGRQADLLALLATTVVLALPGRRFFLTALKLARHGTADMNTLIAIGTGSAYLASLFVILWPGWAADGRSQIYLDTTATIITLVLLGRMLEARAKKRTGDALSRLIREQPKTARVLRDGIERELSAAEILTGDFILLRPGEKVPVDGVVTDGLAVVDDSLLTGESVPSTKKRGEQVIGGSVTVDGSMTIEATAVGRNTVISRMIRLVEEAQATKAPIQALADRIAAVFVPAVIGTAVVTLVLWLTVGHSTFQTSMMNFIAVLIIACPCALGLATPTAVISGSGRAASRGILIRNAESLQLAGSVGTVIFDKTGTITEGRPSVRDVLTANGIKISELLRIAAGLERHSLHPFARAIVDHAGELRINAAPVERPVGVPGKGIEAMVDGRAALAGSLSFMRERGVSDNLELINHSSGDEHSVVFIAIGGLQAGAIILHDPLNATSRDAVTRLTGMGIESVLLSGDKKAIAERIGSEVGILKVVAEVLPDEKAGWVRRLQAEGKVVAMVGDGINDAPALAAADVGIAMGRGIDLAIESSGITLIRNDLRGVSEAIAISRRTIRTIKQNLFWAFIYNAVGIPLAAFGFLHPMIAAGAMAFSSVSVVANSLRLRHAGR